MSSAGVRVEERRAHGVRCAYCHGSLDEPTVVCPSCHVECHEDCSRQLGRCPTLGCPESVSPRPAATASLPPSTFAATRTASVESPPVARVPGIGMFVASMAVGAVALATLGWQLSSRDPSRLAMGVFFVSSFTSYVLAFLVGWRIFRLARTVPRLGALLREAPVPGVLTIEAHPRRGPGRRKRGWRIEASLALEGRSTGEALELDVRAHVDEPWLLHSQVVPVNVRGSSRPGALLLESPAGLLALVARKRRAPAAPALDRGSRSVRSRARRSWRR